ncbi:MAG: hypothetical protein HY934_01065 [Candidatus Firestonebacteria bacterium]|nr:hypothetical protein [Candidatus Firestonebacteria bacterium]
MPIGVFKVRLGYEMSIYFGTYPISFNSKNNFNDDIRKEYKGNGDSGSSDRIIIQPTLQMKLGKTIIRNQTDLSQYSFYASNTDLTSRRLGGIFVYIPDEKLWGYKNPRLFLQSGIYLEDPNRKDGFFIIAGAGVDFNIYFNRLFL